jgi:F-box/leucine-rich repeat protein 2/20
MAIRRVEHGLNGISTPGTSTLTSALPLDMRPLSRGALSPLSTSSTMPEILEDYFSLPLPTPKPIRVRRCNFDFWGEMPHEIKLAIFAHLEPKQLVRASIVSKAFHKTCFDGQLWTCFDASEFYKEIPAESLAKIIMTAGPFVKDLNLRGCIQVEHYKRADLIVKACRNLKNATLEGCRNFQRSTLHSLLKTNGRLANLNLTGLVAVTNGTCRIIAQSCPSLEMFNVSWCTHMDARGIKAVILGCPNLRDLRAGEIKGFNDVGLAQDIFESNRLERLVLSGCGDITDEALTTMIAGQRPEIDILTDLPLVPTRKLRHLDLSRCNRLTSVGVKILTSLVPDLEGLSLSGCTALTDNAISSLLGTTPRLTHLDLEELSELTNAFLSEDLAKAPCAPILEHLSISYCESLGDTGMLPVIRACTSLKSVDMDNTRISDLVLAEAASMVRTRSSRTTCSRSRPRIGLRMVVFDCQNVTWMGIREVLSRNSEVKKPPFGIPVATTYPTEIISLKCFYGWQSTVEEVTGRVLKGDLAAAARLERRWGEYMISTEEAVLSGAGGRRRRRRMRQAAMLHADEEEGGVGMGGVGRRRRARSNGCAIM